MKPLVGVFLTIFFLGLAIIGSAQIINVPKRVETKTVNRVNQHIDKGIDKGLDAVEDGVTGKNKKTEKDQTGTPETGKADQKKAADNPASESKSDNPQEQPSLQSFSKYDFVPGEKVLYYDDFSQDAVGDFPALWTANAAGEINTLSIAPGNWLNLNSTDGNYFYLKNIDFPKNFIMEFDLVPKKTGGRIAAGLILYAEDKPKEMDNNPHPGNSGIMISIEKERWNTMGYKTGESAQITGTSVVNPVEPEKVNHVIIWVQNRRLRIYHKSAKVLDMPTNIYDGTKFNRFCFRLSRGASCGSYISNIRITDASPDMRNKLMTEGKLVTYGIYFDVNKDEIKPESYGTLKGIADILNEVPDVKVKILGFTDSDGADAANLDLSKRRAAAVKNELVKSFNVKGDRLVTDGLGEGQPVAPNDTPANKALNRRVEFIKM
jgi:OmpA-OmpF porin, OOP family